MAKLTKRVVDAAERRSTRYFLWCGELKGFGIRINPDGRSTYYVDYRRADGIRRRLRLGDHGPLTCEEARKLALVALGAVAKGGDPLSEKAASRQGSMTVAELCEEYLKAARAGLVMTRFKKPKRPSTIAIDEGRVSRHIIPLIGKVRVSALLRSDVQKMIDAISAGQTAGRIKTKKRGLARVTGGAGPRPVSLSCSVGFGRGRLVVASSIRCAKIRLGNSNDIAAARKIEFCHPPNWRSSGQPCERIRKLSL